MWDSVRQHWEGSVADTENNCIQVFAAEGKFLRMFGNEGEAKERLNQLGGY